MNLVKDYYIVVAEVKFDRIERAMCDIGSVNVERGHKLREVACSQVSVSFYCQVSQQRVGSTAQNTIVVYRLAIDFYRCRIDCDFYQRVVER